MSRAYSRRRKAKRRVLDRDNPERVRIRRLIRKGTIPRYQQHHTAWGKTVNGRFYHQGVTIHLRDTFRQLTESEPTYDKEK